MERALAMAPLPSEPEPAPVRARARKRPARRVARWDRAFPARPDSGLSSSLRCGICAGSDVLLDEVMHEGLLRLAQCRRCAHRWTERPREVDDVRDGTGALDVASPGWGGHFGADPDLLPDLPF